MAEEKLDPIDIDQLLDDADDLSNNTVSYVTHTRVRVSGNDVTLDLYQTLPIASSKKTVPKAKLLHRIVLPLGLAKDLSTSLASGVAFWENNFGIELPFNPVEGSLNESDNSIE